MKTINNRDTGSLKIGTNEAQVGQKLQITGEPKVRTITYLALGSSAERTCAYFKGQGPVPTGDVEFTLLPVEVKA